MVGHRLHFCFEIVLGDELDGGYPSWLAYPQQAYLLGGVAVGCLSLGSHSCESPCIVILGEDPSWLTQETRWLGFKSLISVTGTPLSFSLSLSLGGGGDMNDWAEMLYKSKAVVDQVCIWN